MAKILIVEDHPIFRRGLCDIIAGDSSLRLVGEAADGKQAVEQVGQLMPEIVLMDLAMPVSTIFSAMLVLHFLSLLS